jgi:glycosyltransferase involved in cell wall biosynthesis
VKPLRVLIVAPWGERAGGSEQMLWALLRHINRDRIEAVVVFLAPGPFAEEVSGLGFDSLTIAAGRLRQPRAYASAVRRLAELIRAQKPDLVAAWSAKAHLYLGVANVLARSGAPAVWWQHGITTGGGIDRTATVIRARAIGCSSEACAAAQSRLHPRRRTFVVYPGVEPEPADHLLSRAELGIPEDAWVVGSVGRLQPSKGHARVISAVAALREQGIPAAGLIVGGEAFGLSRGHAAELAHLVDELDLGDAIVFTGQVERSTPYYAVMDAVAVASDAEGFGLTVVEALLAQRPVVTCAAGGPAEIIEHGVSGLVVDDEGLTGALAAIATDEELARSLAAAGAQRATTFDADQSARVFTDAVQRLLREVG